MKENKLKINKTTHRPSSRPEEELRARARAQRQSWGSGVLWRSSRIRRRREVLTTRLGCRLKVVRRRNNDGGVDGSEVVALDERTRGCRRSGHAVWAMEE